MFQVSETTQKILKNFSGITDHVILQPGTEQRTMLPSKSVLAVAHLPEAWPARPSDPKETAIFKLSQFVQVLSVFDSPIIDFKDDAMVVQQEVDKRLRIKHRYSDPTTIDEVPRKMLPNSNPAVTFTLAQGALNTLKKTASLLNLTDFSVIVENGNVAFRANDAKVPNSHEFDFDVLPADITVNDRSYDRAFRFKREYLGYLLDGDYKVHLAGWKYAYFENTSAPVSYYIADQTGQE